ncbi:hypothetical protein GJ744_006445 [Endocarpon pusillum]|uniref:Uncharacterized protein n=1 Tax=Endocarpon pusillum TaxID=364733 RepID=A0A8H7A4X0_9EURO|nr:hypothetical protein GJ744_006445 [Endocarpon pusillum]
MGSMKRDGEKYLEVGLSSQLRLEKRHVASQDGSKGLRAQLQPASASLVTGEEIYSCTAISLLLHNFKIFQPGVDVLESGAVEGGGRAGGASDGDEKEGAWGGTSRHADQHAKPGVDVLESRADQKTDRKKRRNEASRWIHRHRPQ